MTNYLPLLEGHKYAKCLCPHAYKKVHCSMQTHVIQICGRPTLHIQILSLSISGLKTFNSETR